jgi:hypothetical protein
MADPDMAPTAGATKENVEAKAKIRIPIDTKKLGATAKKKARRRRSKDKGGRKAAIRAVGVTAFPRHSILKCLRIPQAILEQNAGKECKDRDAAKFAGVAYNGDIGVEISSATKYGLLERPTKGMVKPTDLVRRIVRPQKPNDNLEALREGVVNSPVVGDVYKHYRGENLPDKPFLRNTSIDQFGVPEDKADFFVQLFIDALNDAKLLEEVTDGKERVLDVTYSPESSGLASEEHLKKIKKGMTVQATDTCFVMQPFASPLGSYFESIYAPAIQKAGLTPVRADADIFGTGKIIDQIWEGINGAKVLVAELTTKNSNVFYELGLAHAKHKPVVLISSNEQDVPFDLRHVRVIYYDVTDPFWGNKLIDKVAENILSALRDPKDAILFKA